MFVNAADETDSNGAEIRLQADRMGQNMFGRFQIRIGEEILRRGARARWSPTDLPRLFQAIHSGRLRNKPKTDGALMEEEGIHRG